MTKKKEVRYRGSAHDLDVMFYRRFDPDLLFNKALALTYMAKESDRFGRELHDEYPEFDDAFDDHFFASLRAEVHFAELHQFESFFAVLIAPFQPEPHWVYLSRYRTADIKTAIQRFVDADFGGLTGDLLPDARAFFQHAIYSGGSPYDAELGGRWNENLDAIQSLLLPMAARYLEGTATEGGEYNAYKHGLRVMTGYHGFQVSHQNDDGTAGTPVFGAETEDSISYLQFKDVGEGGDTAYEATKYISPNESFANVTLVHQMLQSTVRTRRARLTGDDGPFTIQEFLSVDRERLSQLGARSLTIAITI